MFRTSFFLLPPIILLLVVQFAGSTLAGFYYAIPTVEVAVLLSGYFMVLLTALSKTKVSSLFGRASSCILFFCCIPLAVTSISRQNNDRRAAMMELGILLRELPENSKLFTTDFSGTLSLFSQLRVVNGDGLVNSHIFMANYLTKGRVGDFIHEEDIDYYLSWRVKSSDLEAIQPDSSITETFRPWFLSVPFSTVELYPVSLKIKSLANQQEKKC